MNADQLTVSVSMRFKNHGHKRDHEGINDTWDLGSEL
jgi:hypothetical protein